MKKPITSKEDPDSRRKYSRWHYHKNKELYKTRASIHKAKTREEVRRYINNYLLLHPCVDCNERNPIVLEFDHVGKKRFNIGDAVRMCYSLSSVKKEINQCEVRCANCHRITTYKRKEF